MTAQIGYDGLDLRGDPRPELLIDVARVQPEPGGDWVHLGRLGFRSTQRLWIGDYADGVAVATWAAELKPQACYLYGGGLGSALVTAAIERGWTVEPSPHIQGWMSAIWRTAGHLRLTGPFAEAARRRKQGMDVTTCTLFAVESHIH